jgi:hypothetical protein
MEAKGWSCNSVVEHLPSRCDTLGSIPESPEKGRRKKEWELETMEWLLYY